MEAQGSARMVHGEVHREFPAAGGLSLLIGDGKLDYSTGRILETDYALRSTRASPSPPTINSS
jgi:hypothetical protein